MDYAEMYGKKDLNFWKAVLFTDENEFKIFGGEKHRKILRKKNQELAELVIVQGCFAASGVGELEFIKTTINEYTKQLVESILNRINSVKNAKGAQTKY